MKAVSTKVKLSLVVPCFNEAENVRPFTEACRQVLEGAVDSYELVFVNDGSRDDTWQELKKLAAEKLCPMKLVCFSRNFGKEAAMYAGLQHAAGDYVTVIDADLQQRPEVALEMVRLLDDHPEYDAVAAYQETRHEGKFTAWCKGLAYKLLNKMCEINFREGASDFRTFRRGMVEAILSMKEYHRFSKGIFSWVGFNTHYIPYNAEERNAGTTSWSFGKLLKYAMEGTISFTTVPLKISTVVGVVMFFASILYIIGVIIEKLAFGIATSGYATIVILILLIGGVQLITLGIMGDYIARIYIQSKNRPVFIIKETADNVTEERSE